MEADIQGQIASPWSMVVQAVLPLPRHPLSPEFHILQAVIDIPLVRLIQPQQ